MKILEPRCATKFVELANGVTLYTERHHLDATAPSTTIVCVHGLGSSSTTFYPVIKPILAALPTAHLLAYDWAGSGSSPTPSSVSSRTASDLVADLDALIAAKAPPFSPLVILAHSAGTHLASRWLLTPSAHARVARVTHVVYLGGPVDPPLGPEVTAMQLTLAAAIEAGGPAAVVDGLVPMLLGATSRAGRPLVVAALRAVTLAQDAEGYAAAIRALSKDMGEGAAPIDWAAIQDRMRVVAVVGEEDVLLGQAVWDVGVFLDRALVKRVARAGHTLTLEAPEETAKAIAEFLQG